MLGDVQDAILQTARGTAADWGIYIKFLSSGEEITIGADTQMDTMSVIKVPLLVTLMRMADAGDIDLDARCTLRDEMRRWGTGVLKSLDSGATITLRDAAALMISVSDNVAADICFEAVGGPARVTDEMQRLGLSSIVATGTALDWFRALATTADASLRGASALELFRVGHPAPPPVGSGWLYPHGAGEVRERFHNDGARPFGLATAREAGRLLEMIGRGECASRTACTQMIEMLRAQVYASRVPKYITGGLVAHKTGDFGPFIANDVAIVEGEPYGAMIACFFTANHRGNYPQLEEAIARMAEKAWDYARWTFDHSARVPALS